MMSDSERGPDVYADEIVFKTGHLGCALNFYLSSADQPNSDESTAPHRHQVTVRVSLEMAKVLAYLLMQQIQQHERVLGTHVPISDSVLESLGITEDQWLKLWEA